MWFWKRRRRATTADEVAALATATAGLLYPSESDVPFDVVRWSAASTSAEAEISRRFPAASVERQSLTAWLAALDGVDDAARFAALCKTLGAKTESPTAYRVRVAGAAGVDVYLIGKSRVNGEWIGLHTRSIET